MKMHIIATLYQGDNRLGFRVLDSDTGKIIDVLEQQVIAVLKSNQKINNIELVRNTLKGSNGSLDRYTKIQNGIPSGKAPLVIINQIGNVGYTISDYTGKILKLKNSDALSAVNQNGIANGKITNRGNGDYISAISGTYDQIDPPKHTEQPETSKKIETIEKPKVGTSPEQPSVDLNFTEDQLFVLKDYYSWAGLDDTQSNKELNTLNSLLSSSNKIEIYSITPFIYDCLTKLGSSFNIVKAFGQEIGSKLCLFIQYNLPLPKSLATKCASYVSSNQKVFYGALFEEFPDTISNLFKEPDETFSAAAKLYLDYLASYEILGKYKSYETDDASRKKELIKKYALCSQYTFRELRALIGAIDLMQEFSGEVQTIRLDTSRFISDTLPKEDIFYYAIAFSRYDTTLGLDEKVAFADAIGFRPYFFSLEPKTKLELKIGITDKKLESSPIPEFQQVLFNSTPIDSLNYYINKESTIESVYQKQLKALELGQELIYGRFQSFIQSKYSEVKKKKQDEDRRQLEELAKAQRIKDEEFRRKQLESKVTQAQTREQHKKQETKSVNNGLNKLQQDILNKADLSMYDRVDLYKELRSQHNEASTDFSIQIADDMIRRRMTYKDMSSKQRYRINDAINKLLAIVQGSDVQSVSSTVKVQKAQTESNSNNTYQLDDHPEIKKKVDEILSKADSVEMSTVLQNEPFILKICYSIVRYKKASDKQLKHVDAAIEQLHNI